MEKIHSSGILFYSKWCRRIRFKIFLLIPFVVALVERPSPDDLRVQLVDSERSGRKSQSDLVELAMHIQKADAFTRSNVCNKLQVIADQVRFLHEQARRILEETKEAENLHHLAW